MKTLAEVFGNAAGLGSQPLRWRRSITQTDREVFSAYAEGETERPPPNHPYLNDWKGTERKRERDHHQTSLAFTIEGERGLTLTIEGDRERLPYFHPATFI